MRSPDPLYALYWAIWIGAALFIVWRLVRQVQKTLKQMTVLMDEQVNALRVASSAQNLMSLIRFVQDPKTREARAVVLGNLEGKPESKCDDKEKAAAFLVCSSYDVAGILIRHKLVPAPPFITNWGPSIVRCHEALKTFIDSVGAERWDDFAWLRQQAGSPPNLRGE